MVRIYIIVLSFVFLTNIYSQNRNDNFYVNTIAGLGYGIFLTDLNSEGLNKGGINTSLRFMWQPQHLLRVGLETGYIQIYSQSASNVDTEYGTTDINAKLTVVPIIAVYSMQIIENLELNIGTGLYLVSSTVDSHGNEVTSSAPSTGFMLSSNYFHPINNSISLGGELKWHYINKIHDSSLSLQFVFKYTLLQY